MTTSTDDIRTLAARVMTAHGTDDDIAALARFAINAAALLRRMAEDDRRAREVPDGLR